MSIKQKIQKRLFPWKYTKRKLSRYGFEKMGSFSDEDVFIIGYPKSGTTMMQFLLAYLVYKLPKNASFSLINCAVTEYYNNPYYFRLESRHFFKSHELPNKQFKKVIYIIRDGREVVLSQYRMLKNLGQEVSLKQLYESGGDSFVGTWANHILAWIENPYCADILYIKYEDLLSDKKQVILKIADFLDLSDYNCEEVMDGISLENMKEQEQGFSWSRSKNHLNWSKEGSFVRQNSNSLVQFDSNSEDCIKAFEMTNHKALQAYKMLF